ncbi:MAG: type IV secretory system conjugative DNA transfer family protein [Clostridia bacterium]|nr:type IV secretory system conjugative DNA transfer family protein [Clostridia bacterium]MDD4386241.1 type IV secretory system conjugative DNA transfer family protein [Clostridia bacterium]
MLNNFKHKKKEIITIFIIYLLIDIFVIGAFFVSGLDLEKTLTGYERTTKVMSGFMTNLTNPLGTLGKIVMSGQDFFGFLKISFWILIIFIGLYISYLIKNGKKHEYDGMENGSSEWSKNGEEFDKQQDGSEILNKKNGFILSKNHYLGTDLRKVKVNKNILVIGGSGTGKSACYVKPNILQKLGSYVITDPKGELYRETSTYLRNAGWDVKAFNLVDPEFSDRYNPLSHVKDHSDVDIIAHTIVTGGEGDGGSKSADPFWDNTAKMLLKACIYYVISILPTEQQNLSSCLNIVRAGGSDESVFDKLFIDELKPEHPGRKEYEGIRLGADKTKQSIAISLVSKLSHFDTPDMQKITTSNNIDFEALGQKKTAIFVITPADHSTYNYIVTIFFSQLLVRLYSQASKNGGTLSQQVYLVMDEFANVGQIPDFSKKLSTTRSLGVSVSIIIQSLDQLEGLYKDTWENIIANCDTQIFLGCKSIKTCEYICKSLGQKTIKFSSKSVSKDKNEWNKQGVSISEQRQGRDLMTIDEIMRMENNSEIILIRGMKPIKAEKAWYYKYHQQRDIAKQTEIKDITEMVKPEEVEISTMNITNHLEQRLKKAKEKIKDDSLSIIGDTLKSDEKKEIINNNNTILEKEDSYDLQKQLEAKFDELFGETNKH